MSTLKVNQVKAKLLNMFEKHLDLVDISSTDQEREVKVLSRCLAALSIYLETGCTEELAAQAVWDGSGDNGIDGAYFEPSDSRVIFVQSKWIKKGSGEPTASDVGTFVKGVRDIVERDYVDFDNRLHAKLNDIGLKLENPGTHVHLVVSSTGASRLSALATSRLAKFLAELNGDDPDPIASSSIFGLDRVYSGLADDPLSTSVSLDATLLDWSYISSPYPAYFGLIDAAQLKEWWKHYGRRLVAANIRHSLGATEVNSQIRQTATATPENFWYFNNGITLVAEEAIKAPANAASRAAGVFTFKGASVVNGAQTLSTLAKVENDVSLGTVRVSIRVILLKTAPEGFGKDVTRTNNLQNRVEARDFVAQDTEQKRLREEMSIEGIEYQYVRSEEIIPTPTSCELLEVTTALACALGDPNIAVQLKTGIGRFFSDLRKAPYKSIFNSSVSGAYAFNVVLVQREIDQWIEAKQRSLPKKSGPAWGILIHGNRILSSAVFRKLGSTVFNQSIVDFKEVLSTLDSPHICEDVHARMIDAVQSKFPSRFLSVLFKNPTESKQVFESLYDNQNF